MDPRDRVLDIVIAAAATAAELALLLDDGSSSFAAVLITVAAGGALALRRVAPLAALGATLVAASAIVAIGEVPSGLSVLIALFTTAATQERRVSLAALAPTVVVVIAVSVIAADPSPSSAAVGALAAGPLAGGIWGLGAYVRTRRRYREELEARAELLERERDQLARLAVHEERAAIARELHDIVAHSVGVMLLGVRGARDVLRTAPDAADETLAHVERSGERSVAELRRILALLRDRSAPADSRPQPSLAEIADLVEEHRATGLDVRFEVHGTPTALPEGVELSAYRIVQEALTNARRHGAPTQVAVSLAFHDARLDVEIEDDGPAASAARGPGHGLVGMRERVALLGGELELGPGPAGGFSVACAFRSGATCEHQVAAR